MRASKAAFIDIDGTLVDSNDAHARAWHEAFTWFGHEVPLERVRQAIGMGGDNLMPSVIGVMRESDEGRVIARHRQKVFTSMLPDISAFDCTRGLLERLHADGFKLVIATSAPRTEMYALLEIARVADLVDGTVAGDDVERSKPAPDVICAALATAGLSAQACRLLGDTPYDIAAAAAAHVSTIGLRSGGFSDHALSGALALYDDLADVFARYDASPFSDIVSR